MANEDYQLQPGGPFCPVALLAANIDQVGETITFANLSEPYPNSIAVGMTLLIDDELVLMYEYGTGTMKCRRGCGDTIPAAHLAAADIWFIEAEVQELRREYAGGDEITVKILPYIPGGDVLAVAESTPQSVTMNWRFIRPYPPAQVRVNGARWFVTASLTSNTIMLHLTWVDRNRVTQGDQLVGHDEANVSPEPGTTYTVRIYDHIGRLVRTEVGLTGHAYDYQWSQAINDFEVGTSPEGANYNGHMEFESSRDGFSSWQFYRIAFVLNNKVGIFELAQASEQISQRTNETLIQGLVVGEFGEQTGQGTTEVSQHTLMVGPLAETASQQVSYMTDLTRKLFEAPYTHLLRLGMDPNRHNIMIAVARPSDRLTDSYSINSRTDSAQPYIRHPAPVFTPWLIINETLEPLDTVSSYTQTSLTDGIALTNVIPGQIALLGAEIVRIEALNSTHVTIARGCVDTVPAVQQPAGTRLWFIAAGGGLDCRNIHHYKQDDVVDERVLPDVYGVPLLPSDAPSDAIKIVRRSFRPFPPGRLRVNGLPWYKGAATWHDEPMVFTWTQRNRATQGDSVVDHTADTIAHESGTRYRFMIQITARDANDDPVLLKIREVYVTGERWEYPYDQQRADGYRIAQLFKACGWVTVPMYVDAQRDGYSNWQGYSVPVTLPAPPCPINVSPGGGQNPRPPSGNGDVGDTGGTGGTGGPPGSGPPPDPPPPIKPPDWPPVPPDPIKPTDPGEPNPDDTEPDPDDTGEHWDFTWDIHWDAYRRYGDKDIGEG